MSKPKCKTRWQIRIGKITLKHACGEDAGHTTPHVCKDCGVTKPV